MYPVLSSQEAPSKVSEFFPSNLDTYFKTSLSTLRKFRITTDMLGKCAIRESTKKNHQK